MSRRTAGVVFSCLGVVLFLARYAFAIWYRGPHPTALGAVEFGRLLGYIGIMPWILAAVFFLVGLYYLAVDERDRPHAPRP